MLLLPLMLLAAAAVLAPAAYFPDAGAADADAAKRRCAAHAAGAAAATVAVADCALLASPGCPADAQDLCAVLCRARGISAEVARQLLVYSFGREVVQQLRDESLEARVQAAVRAALASFTGEQ